MKMLILCSLIVLIIASPACALFELTSLDEYIDRYNYNMDKAPGILKTLLGSEKVELDISLNNGSQFKIGLEVNNGLVVSTTKGGIEDHTILIQTKEDVIQTMSQSPDPITAFQQAKEAGTYLYNWKQLSLESEGENCPVKHGPAKAFRWCS